MKTRIALVLVLVVLVGIVAYKTVFVPVSVDMMSHPAKVFANSSEPVDIKVVALNRMGFRIPFMRLHGRFLIPEGAEKIQVIKTGNDEMLFRTLDTTGKLVVLYYTPVLPFPVEIVLNIETSSLAFVNPSAMNPS